MYRRRDHEYLPFMYAAGWEIRGQVMLKVVSTDSLPTILLISTGGTISMTPQASGGVTPTLTGEDLIKSVPSIAQYCTLKVITYGSKPGASLDWSDLLHITELINHEFGVSEVAGAVVVQGTDTIEETAYILDLLVDSDKPIVVTGAMRSAAMLSADGPANILAAIIAASSKKMCGKGAVVVLNDEIHAARFVRKSHTALPSAFTSPGYGIIGSLIEGEVHCPYSNLMPTLSLPVPKSTNIPPVALVKASFADDALLLGILPQLGYQGCVIEAMGAGHLPAHYVSAIRELLPHIPVVLSTRVPCGPIFQRTYDFPGSEMDTLRSGVISGGSLGSLRARILLSLLLANDIAKESLPMEFQSRAMM